MKKFFTGLFAVLFVAIIAFVIGFFAFDKKIPTKWVTAQINAVASSNLEKEITVYETPISSYSSEITYTKDGEKTVVTYDYKQNVFFKNTSTRDSESYQIKNVKFDSHGNMSNIDNFDEIGIVYIAFGPFYTGDNVLNDDIINMIDNHISSVTQKGLNITLHLINDNVKVNITYSLTKKKISRIEKITDTYTENVLTHRSSCAVEF